MKSIKTYLIVVSLLLLVAIASGIYVWYRIQETHVQIEEIEAREVILPKTIEDETVEKNIGTTESVAEVTTPPAQPSLVPEVTEPVVVDTTTLPESQQKILEAFGYDEGTLTITPAMISCAEEAVGKDRLGEIMKGSAPSALESIKILPCFKA